MVKYIAILSILICSCAAIKQKKDEKAIGRVINDPNLLAKVGKYIGPCTNDTVTMRDTLYDIVLSEKWDTVYEYRNDTTIKWLTRTEYKDRVREVTKYVTDNRRIGQLQDTANHYRNIAISMGEKFAAKDAENKDIISRNRTLKWVIVALSVLCVLLGVLFFKRKTKV